MLSKILIAAVAGLALVAQPSEAVSCMVQTATVNGVETAATYTTVSYDVNLPAENNLTADRAVFSYSVQDDSSHFPPSTLITTSQSATLVVNGKTVNDDLPANSQFDIASALSATDCHTVIRLSTKGSRTMSTEGITQVLDSCEYNYEFNVYNANCNSN